MQYKIISMWMICFNFRLNWHMILTEHCEEASNAVNVLVELDLSFTVTVELYETVERRVAHTDTCRQHRHLTSSHVSDKWIITGQWRCPLQLRNFTYSCYSQPFPDKVCMPATLFWFYYFYLEFEKWITEMTLRGDSTSCLSGRWSTHLGNRRYSF